MSQVSVNKITLSCAAGGSASTIIDLHAYQPDDSVKSAQVVVTGSGTVTLSYEVANINDDSLFGSGANIVVGAVAGSHNFAQFDPDLCRYLKITATETGAVNTADVDLYLEIR